MNKIIDIYAFLDRFRSPTDFSLIELFRLTQLIPKLDGIDFQTIFDVVLNANSYDVSCLKLLYFSFFKTFRIVFIKHDVELLNYVFNSPKLLNHFDYLVSSDKLFSFKN